MTKEDLLYKIIILCDDNDIDYDIDELERCCYEELKIIKEFILDDFKFSNPYKRHIKEVMYYIGSLLEERDELFGEDTWY